MDTIIIRDLDVRYHVGVTDEERAQPQQLLISLKIAHDFTNAVAGDDLAETIDYEALSRRLLSFGEGRHWSLIETLASDVAALVIDDFGARRVTVEVKKFVIPQARFVGVRLTRERS